MLGAASVEPFVAFPHATFCIRAVLSLPPPSPFLFPLPLAGRVCTSIDGPGGGEQQIGQEIGRGGFGTVFQALNTATGDFVAVKRMDMDSVQLDAGASIKASGR